jgi:hypothetical protein
VDYNKNGDTINYNIFKDNTIIKSWSKNPQNDVVFIVPTQTEAKFPGGQEGWVNFLSKNLYCPDSLKNIKGRVYVKFRINPNGIIDQVEIIKSLNPVLDKIVIDVIKQSPAWIPATEGGKNINFIQKQYVNFN